MPAPPRDETPIDSDPPGESEPAVPMRILDGIADGLVTLDREWRYTYVNAHAARIFGRPRSELLGECVWDLFPFIVGTEMERQMRRAADEQVTCEFQGHDAAMERSYENLAFPTPDGGVAVYSRDVTERRRNERLIDSARAYAEGIVTTVREPLLILDDDLRVVSANRSFYATFQVGLAETEGRAVYELGDGQWDIPGLRTLLEEIVPANSWFDDFEVEHDFEQIGRKTMLLNARRFPPEGPFKLLLLAIEDITARRQAEEKNRRSEALLAEAQELAHVGSWNWDLATDLITWSDEHYRIFGLERQEGPMTFERGISVIHPDDLPRVRRTVDEALRDHEPYDCSLRLLRRDGSVRFVHSRGLAVYDQDGKPIRMYGTVEDVTDRTHAEEALRRVNTRVELALRGSDIGIWESEFPDGTLESARIVFTSVWEQLGYGKPASTPDFAAGSSLIHPDERDRMGDAFAHT